MLIVDQLNALLKWSLSFRSNDWSVEDYPLSFRDQGESVPPEMRLAVVVVNWFPMCGLGTTRDEALESLQGRLDAYAASHGSLPRPGTRVAIEYASSREIDRHAKTVEQILTEVLGFEDFADLFISDGSSLWDFCEPEATSVADLLSGIEEEFGVDVSDLEDGNLLEIARRIDGFD